jgi:ABC-type Fe3+-hydroxamate transport system substrate-binding protein
MPQLKRYIDQLGVTLHCPVLPKRIVSLVPSQTELLWDLGLDTSVVGITKFCIHPREWFHRKIKVGGTKSFDFEKIHHLQPDLIIGNKEENYAEGISRLRQQYPVWMSDIVTLEDALEMILSIGEITGKHQEAHSIVGGITSGFESIAPRPRRKALYLIWRKPWMAAGTKTFIHEMLTLAGFDNVVSQERYPTLTEEELRTINPDIIMLSSEPYPFDAKHAGELGQLMPDRSIVFVDGEMFSWYGSRLKYAASYFNSLPY